MPHTLSGRSAEVIEAAKSIEGLTGIKIRLREAEGRRNSVVASLPIATAEGDGKVADELEGSDAVAKDSTSTDPPKLKSLKRSSSKLDATTSPHTSTSVPPRKRSKPERWIGAAAALEEKAAKRAEEAANGLGSRGNRKGSSAGRDREKEAKDREELANGSVRYRF